MDKDDLLLTEFKFLVIVAILVLAWFFIRILNNQDLGAVNTKIEHPNTCRTELSCLCRDKCSDIYGHSDWESWVYKRNSECWCIEQNETRRMF